MATMRCCVPASCPTLEHMLVEGIIGQRRELLVDAVTEGLTRLVAQNPAKPRKRVCAT
jgi:hypothetical protein